MGARRRPARPSAVRQRYADAIAGRVETTAAEYAAGLTRRRRGPLDKPRMLVVAPSAELYGSDRSLLNVAPELTQSFDVTIVFAGQGPAVALAEDVGASTLVLPDFAFRRSNLTARGIIPWFRRARRPAQPLEREHLQDPFAIVYSNTLAAGLGITFGRRHHVTGARARARVPARSAVAAARALFTVARSTSLVICNSAYTRGS